MGRGKSGGYVDVGGMYAASDTDGLDLNEPEDSAGIDMDTGNEEMTGDRG